MFLFRFIYGIISCCDGVIFRYGIVFCVFCFCFFFWCLFFGFWFWEKGFDIGFYGSFEGGVVVLEIVDSFIGSWCEVRCGDFFFYQIVGIVIYFVFRFVGFDDYLFVFYFDGVVVGCCRVLLVVFCYFGGDMVEFVG